MSAPTLAARPAAANVFDMLGSAPAPNTSASTSSFSSLSTPPMQPTTAQSPRTNYPSATLPSFNIMSLTNSSPTPPSTQIGSTAAPAPAPAKASSNFDDLWSMSFGGNSSSKPMTGDSSATGKSIKDLEKEKASASMWGSSASAKVGLGSGAAPRPATSSPLSGGVDDLLL